MNLMIPPESGSAALPGGRSAVDDTPVSSAGDWYVVDPSTLYGAGIHVDGWAAYEASNVWGNYPGDNQLSGSYLMNDAVYDSFIAEFENKVNPLSLVQLAQTALEQMSDPEESLAFINKVTATTVQRSF